MSGSNCCFLIQVSYKTGKMIWYSHFFKNFPQFVVICTFNGSNVVNEAEVDVFLEFPYFFYDPTYVGNLISGSSAFSKYSLYIWKFLVVIVVIIFFTAVNLWLKKIQFNVFDEAIKINFIKLQPEYSSFYWSV